MKPGAGQSSTFQKTFGLPPKTSLIQLNMRPAEGMWDLRIDDRELFTDKESAIRLVRRWRRDYPFLHKWFFTEASLAWNHSVLVFQNIDKGVDDDLALDSLIAGNGGFTASRTLASPQRKFLPVFEILPAMAGGITFEYTQAIQPVSSVNLSEFSLQYLASYLLSSLVRYRPQTWQHAISRSITHENPADDRSLALVEQFLDLVLASFPKLVIHAIDYTRVP